MSLIVTETKVKLTGRANDYEAYPEGCPGAWICVTRRSDRAYVTIAAGPYALQAPREEAAAFAAAVRALATR